ncbi:MAG: N-acetylmuramoyl-L-alanine amidase [Chloroflexota bacterium]
MPPTTASLPLRVATLLVLAALLVPASLAPALLAPSPVHGQDPATPPTIEVSGSPLLRDEPGRGVLIRVTLREPAHLRLLVTDFDGQVVRELYDGDRGVGDLGRRWRGRDADGRLVAVGAYRVRAIASTAAVPTGVASDAWVTVADHAAYPADPGAITGVVDPGHGGPFDGAVARDGTREADLNLDIGLRLARMLEGAGVHVVLTRDSDRQVDQPPIDRIPDGILDVTDDLAARADLANAVRADLFIAIHNNTAVDRTTGGPSTYYSDERTFSARSRHLARIIQAHMVAALDAVGSGAWAPYDHGVLAYPYYVLRDYDPPRLLRPSQMPAVLSEGLFLSNPRELRMLQRPRVRQAMAVAYYESVVEYLATRGSHVGYALLRAPTTVEAGSPVELELEVRDQGTTTLRGWHLAVGAQVDGSTALGRARPGGTLGERRIPTRRPGQRRTLRVTATAPVEPGRWVLLVDARGPTGGRASEAGSPMLQVPIEVTAPASADSSVVPASPTPGSSVAPTP